MRKSRRNEANEKEIGRIRGKRREEETLTTLMSQKMFLNANSP